MSAEPLESQIIANALRELQKYPISNTWIRNPQFLADVRKYGAEETVRCLHQYRMLPSDIAERVIR